MNAHRVRGGADEVDAIRFVLCLLVFGLAFEIAAFPITMVDLTASLLPRFLRSHGGNLCTDSSRIFCDLLCVWATIV